MITTDPAEIARAVKLLDPQTHRMVLREAVKQTMRDGKAMIVDEIQEETTISTKYARRAVTMKLVSDQPPVGEIDISYKPVPLVAFQYRATKRGGVTVLFSRSGNGSVEFKHAFTARVASAAQAAQGISRKGIFLRKKANGKNATRAGFAERLPIRQLYGPPVTRLVDAPKIKAEIGEKLEGLMVQNLAVQLNKLTGITADKK